LPQIGKKMGMKRSNAPRVSVIVTVLNEAETILPLLDSLLRQTFPADEVIIVDGGSVDNTVQIVKNFAQEHPALNLSLIPKKGNRSVGRNAAILAATNKWIAITDAGCRAQPNWLEELVTQALAMQQSKIASSTTEFAVAGYYGAQPETTFASAVVPYVLVMPDKVDPNNFLPATRSMIISKSAWQKVAGFDESLSDNEDYAFARQLKRMGVRIGFAAHAQVTWQPRANLRQFFGMIFRFARGDIYARILRPKVALVFGRYLAALFLLFVLLVWLHFSTFRTSLIFLTGLLIYGIWSIKKNYRYALQGWFWLPILQVTADIAVMLGSLAGCWQLRRR